MSFLRRLFTLLAALLLLFEEWGWEPLATLAERLSRLPLWARVEQRIAGFPPWAAVVVFFVPALALLPVKLLAVFFVGQGHALWGVAVLLLAKVAGTAVVARLFRLTQPALMRLQWFACWYPRWKAWKDVIMEQVRSSSAWRQARRWRELLHARWAAWRRWLTHPPR